MVRLTRRGRVVVGAAAVVPMMAVVAAGASVASANGNGAALPDAASAPAPAAADAGAPPTTITLSATGDNILGTVPNFMPPNDGIGFYDDVKDAMAADLVMGNLEQPLTEDTGVGKCGGDTSSCFQFRLPPSYTQRFVDAGYMLLNTANNHAYDFGAKGHANTLTALALAGIKSTGEPDQITVVDVKGVKVAVIGFSPYAYNNLVTDIPHAQALVRMAHRFGDVVVVQAHMGAEGSDKTRLTGQSEIFFGEDRGNPIAFSRAMVDAGADLVIGHGPHVMRGMEFYKDRLIAYSLGNFAGGSKVLSNTGALGLGGILRVSLNSDGTWAGGSFVSTYMNGVGAPTIDPAGNGQALLADLNASDLPETGVAYDEDGTIILPKEQQ